MIQARNRGGRPSREVAGQMEDKILDAAAALFFKEGYGATSIEKIASHARISKRTFYVRYENKAAIFRAVVHRIMRRLRPADAATDQLFKGLSTEAVLRKMAPIIVKASLSVEALALYRIVVAEAMRFPELALILHEQGARQEALRRIADLLEKEVGRDKGQAVFAAEQFLFMLTAAPQRRSLGLGVPMKDEECLAWANNTVNLFLNGYAAVTAS